MILYWMETTHMQDHVVIVVVTVVLYPLFFEGLDVVFWLHTIHLSFYCITNLMIHCTKNTFYRKMIHTCWKYEFPELILIYFIWISWYLPFREKNCFLTILYKTIEMEIYSKEYSRIFISLMLKKVHSWRYLTEQRRHYKSRDYKSYRNYVFLAISYLFHYFITCIRVL